MYALGEIPRKSAILFPHNTATVFEGTRLTYRQLNERVNRLANGLIGLGVGKGDRLAVLAENTHKYLEVYFAASKLGISVCPLNFRQADQEVVHIVNDSEATCFFAAEGYESRAMKLKENVPNIKYWIAMDSQADGYLYYENLLTDASPHEPGRDADEEEMAILMYTGGTTGLPKGVMMSHRGLMNCIISAVLGFSFNRNDATYLSSRCSMYPSGPHWPSCSRAGKW